MSAETPEEFDRRCDLMREQALRLQNARALVFCPDCKSQHRAATCPRCQAFREGRPWRHEEIQ